jgi:prevent-host-death family protein
MEKQDILIGAFEAKTKFSALLDRVEKGEEILITRKGKTIAKLIRFEREPTATDRREAIERISRLADKRSLKGISWKALRDGGRKY